MPEWFSWKNNLIFGGVTLIVLAFAIYVQLFAEAGPGTGVVWACLAGFAFVWAMLNFWMWRAYVGRQKRKGGP